MWTPEEEVCHYVWTPEEEVCHYVWTPKEEVCLKTRFEVSEEGRTWCMETATAASVDVKLTGWSCEDRRWWKKTGDTLLTICDVRPEPCFAYKQFYGQQRRQGTPCWQNVMSYMRHVSFLNKSMYKKEDRGHPANNMWCHWNCIDGLLLDLVTLPWFLLYFLSSISCAYFLKKVGEVCNGGAELVFCYIAWKYF